MTTDNETQGEGTAVAQATPVQTPKKSHHKKKVVPPTEPVAPKAEKPPKSLRILPDHLKSGRTAGDVRPHVPIIGGSRRFGAYTRPVSIDISEKMLPPITRKKIATYEVLAFAKKDPLIVEGGNEIAPAPVILPGRYSIYDPFERDLANSIKVVQNVVGKERRDFQNPITGKMESQMTDNIEDIIMENGFYTVNMETEYSKYVFMELHPMNETCKWRQSSKVAAVFRRSDFQQHSSISRQFEMDLAMDAERLVKDMTPEEIINLTAAFNMPTMGRAIHEMRYDLRVLARQDPKKVMFQRKDEFATIRINVKDAMDWGLLEYVPEKMQYYFAGDMHTPMHQVLVGADPQESLAEFCLSTDGVDVYEQILELLSFWK